MRLTWILRLSVAVLTCLLLWAGVLWLLPASAVVRANPGTLFVTVSGSGTACSQAQPCALQTALAQAEWNDTLYVAAGTYTGSGSAVVTIDKTLTLFGGWNGAPAGPVVRDPVAHRSILDGQGARRVVYCHGSLIGFTLDGFTIQRGNATDGPDTGRGGGVYSTSAWPIITNNIITGNTAYTGAAVWGYGGGVYLDSCTAAPLIQGNQVLGNVGNASGYSVGGGLVVRSCDKADIRDNLVLNNTASITNGGGYGGGIAVIQSAGSALFGNTIESNHGATTSRSGAGRGGGVYVELSMGAVLKNNRIRNNVAGVAGSGYGGAVGAYWANELIVANNVLEGNIASALPGATGMGGGMFFYSSPNVNLSANRVLGNAANPTLGSGGGVWVDSGSSFVMVNNVVAGNRAGGYGGGLGAGANETEPVAGTLLHNTFVANNAGSGDGQVGIYLASAWINLELVNNLFSTHSSAVCAFPGSTVLLTRTMFWGDTSGDICPGSPASNYDAIIGQDPLLDGTYHLRRGSPAIDRADSAGVTVDIDGDPRPIGALYDIGADEYTEPHRVYLPRVLKAR